MGLQIRQKLSSLGPILAFDAPSPTGSQAVRDSVKPLLACIGERRVIQTEIYPVFTARLQWCRDAFLLAERYTFISLIRPRSLGKRHFLLWRDAWKCLNEDSRQTHQHYQASASPALARRAAFTLPIRQADVK